MRFRIRFMANMKLMLGKDEMEVELFSPADLTPFVGPLPMIVREAAPA